MGKGENASNQHFLLSPIMFSFSENKLSFQENEFKSCLLRILSFLTKKKNTQGKRRKKGLLRIGLDSQQIQYFIILACDFSYMYV